MYKGSFDHENVSVCEMVNGIVRNMPIWVRKFCGVINFENEHVPASAGFHGGEPRRRIYIPGE